MDPTAAYLEILQLRESGEDLDRLQELCCNLLTWLRTGGFPPEGVSESDAATLCTTVLFPPSNEGYACLDDALASLESAVESLYSFGAEDQLQAPVLKLVDDIRDIQVRIEEIIG